MWVSKEEDTPRQGGPGVIIIIVQTSDLDKPAAVAGPPTAPRGPDPASIGGPYDDCSWRGSVEGGGSERARAFRSICFGSTAFCLNFFFCSVSVYTNFKIEISVEQRKKANIRSDVECVVGTRPTGMLIPSQATGICIADGPWAGLLACLLFLVPNLSTLLLLRFYLCPAEPCFPYTDTHSRTHCGSLDGGAWP